MWYILGCGHVLTPSIQEVRKKSSDQFLRKLPKTAKNGQKWPKMAIFGVSRDYFWIFEFSQIYQYHEVMDTPKLHYMYENWKNLSSRSTRLKDHVFLGQMLKKHPIPSVFNPLIENRKRFPIKEFQPFYKGLLFLQ